MQPRALQKSSEPDPGTLAADALTDGTPATGAQRRVQRRVMAQPVELRFTGLDEHGFGHARDQATDQEFLLNHHTLDYDPARLAKGTLIRAEVTAAHYVVRVLGTD